MDTTEILSRVRLASTLVDPSSDSCVKIELDKLAADLEAKIRLETAKARGSLDAAKAISRMTEACRETRPSLGYAWMDKQGHQCACDGYRAFRLNDPLPLEDRPANAGEPIDLDKIFPAETAMPTVKGTLPAAHEIKAEIALQTADARATMSRAARRKFAPTWDFGENRPAVNAKYLLDMLAVLGNDAEVFFVNDTPHAVAYFRSERGDGLLMPIRTPAKMDQAAKQQAARNAAAQEAREHPEIVERRERHARRLKECMAEYAARVKEDASYAMTPDEFAHLARYADEYAA